MKVRYLDLDDYLSIAVEVTGQQVDAVVQSANLNLVHSALPAPAGSFSGQEFFPDFVDKAAVLIVRLAKNHPLPEREQAGGLGIIPGLLRDQWPHPRSLSISGSSRSGSTGHRGGRLGRACDGCVATTLASRGRRLTCRLCNWFATR